MLFFVSDNFIRDVVREVSGQLSGRHVGDSLRKAAIMVNGDVTLAAYFNPCWPISRGLFRFQPSHG